MLKAFGWFKERYGSGQGFRKGTKPPWARCWSRTTRRKENPCKEEWPRRGRQHRKYED